MTTTNPTPAPTARTDGFINAHQAQWPQWDWQDYASAYADFARTLERELAEANEACHKASLDALYMRDDFLKKITQLERQLAEAGEDKARLGELMSCVTWALQFCITRGGGCVLRHLPNGEIETEHFVVWFARALKSCGVEYDMDLLWYYRASKADRKRMLKDKPELAEKLAQRGMCACGYNATGTTDAVDIGEHAR